MSPHSDGESVGVRVEGGAVPVFVQGPVDALRVPGLVVVPSIYGPAPDLQDQLSGVAESALVVVLDPFWRVGGGVVPYDDHEGAVRRLEGFDRDRCFTDVRAVIDWTRARCNGHVAGLGICFGGPVVLVAAVEAQLAGVIAWHGSRMERFLDRVAEISGPVRLHFGSADAITPPEAIAKIRAAFASHPNASFVVHEGLEHGFSHPGKSYDRAAARAGVDAVREVLADL